jgi:sporulation protein YlmC with PRC-barrel domain
MRLTLVTGTLLASAMLVPALAQSTPPASTPGNRPVAAAPAPAQVATGDVWRASKLKGLNVYNGQNEKLGDINEILLDKSGKVEGVVIGVGGFLGMGEHDIKVEWSKLKFVNEAVRTSSIASSNATTGTGNRPNASANSNASNDRKWYPDHAVLSANKDQLKAMPQFKY